MTPPRSPSTAARQLQLARAWRARLRADAEGSGARLTVVQRCDGRDMAARQLRVGDALHCADWLVTSDAIVDAARLVPRLGELLRLVSLATVPHVGALVLNALSDDDALCGMRSALCARCDAVDRDAVGPTVALSIGCSWGTQRTGVGLLHDALYAWEEETASVEFIQLRDALSATTVDQPTVHLSLILGMFRDDDDAELRDLQALVARNAEDAGPFRLARIFPIMDRACRVQSPYYAPLHTAIVDSGICAQLGPYIPDQSTPEEARHAWQWLLDWVERTKTTPHVDGLTIVRRPGQTTQLLTELLCLVVANNPTLRRLTFFWPLHSETDAEQRKLVAEAIGATLFAPHSSLRLDKLELDLGNLSTDDVAALQRGAKTSGLGSDHRKPHTSPRFQALEWKALEVPEPCIEQVVRLLGVVGVCELELNVGNRDLSYRTMETVLQNCAATLSSLKWPGLRCDDALEFQDATTRPSFPSRLRDLRIFLRNEGDPNTLHTLDALLARVGSNLTSFQVGSFQAPLTARVAEVILARCPHLLALNVANASPQFYQLLTRAYDDGSCGISRLTAQAIPRGLDTGWLALLEALQDPTRGPARKLRVLTLGTIWRARHNSDVVFRTLMATLSTNKTLARVVLEGYLSEGAVQQLHALPDQFAARPPSLRRQLAFISVCHNRDNDIRLSTLPSDVLQVVFVFAGRRAPRYEYFC